MRWRPCTEDDLVFTPLYLRAWVECPCCLFYRGMALGFVLAAIAAAIWRFIA